MEVLWEESRGSGVERVLCVEQFIERFMTSALTSSGAILRNPAFHSIGYVWVLLLLREGATR